MAVPATTSLMAGMVPTSSTTAESPDAVTVDLTAGTVVGGASVGTDTLLSIENVMAGNAAIAIIGNADNNLLIGGDGNDTLSGRDGDDTLRGEAGNDSLLGDEMDDLLEGHGKFVLIFVIGFWLSVHGPPAFVGVRAATGRQIGRHRAARWRSPWT